MKALKKFNKGLRCFLACAVLILPFSACSAAETAGTDVQYAFQCVSFFDNEDFEQCGDLIAGADGVITNEKTLLSQDKAYLSEHINAFTPMLVLTESFEKAAEFLGASLPAGTASPSALYISQASGEISAAAVYLMPIYTENETADEAQYQQDLKELAAADNIDWAAVANDILSGEENAAVISDNEADAADFSTLAGGNYLLADNYYYFVNKTQLWTCDEASPVGDAVVTTFPIIGSIKITAAVKEIKTDDTALYDAVYARISAGAVGSNTVSKFSFSFQNESSPEAEILDESYIETQGSKTLTISGITLPGIGAFAIPERSYETAPVSVANQFGYESTRTWQVEASAPEAGDFFAIEPYIIIKSNSAGAECTISCCCTQFALSQGKTTYLFDAEAGFVLSFQNHKALG